MRHLSLIPFRKDMESVWQEGIHRSAVVAAGRSQLQRNETKCELTEAGD